MSDQESRRFVAVSIGLCTAFWCVATACGEQATDTRSEQYARQVLDRLELERGVCVLLDPSPAELAIALARQSRLTMYAQVPDEDSVERARRRIDRAGLLGTRIYVEKGCWSHVHLADNLADAVVVSPRAVPAAESYRQELMRVVNPLGSVLLGDELISRSQCRIACCLRHARRAVSERVRG